MSRKSVREELRRRLLDHLAIAETHAPQECVLDVRGVAAALHVNPTTLYKHGFNRDINAAERDSGKNAWGTGAAIEEDYFKNQIRALTDELEKERERSKNLVGRIAIMEANAARLGIDPEEMHQPILKPVRTMLRAGRGGGTTRADGRVQSGCDGENFYRQARTIPGIYLLLHQDQWASASGGRYGTIFPRHAAIGASDGAHARGKGLIERTPGVGRSIRLLITHDELPNLE
jgi:hypothetical protein